MPVPAVAGGAYERARVSDGHEETACQPAREGSRTPAGRQVASSEQNAPCRPLPYSNNDRLRASPRRRAQKKKKTPRTRRSRGFEVSRDAGVLHSCHV